MLKYEVGVAVVVVLRLWNVSQVSCWLHSVWTGVTHKSVTTPKFVTTEGAVAPFFLKSRICYFDSELEEERERKRRKLLQVYVLVVHENSPETCWDCSACLIIPKV